jgi:hypothetical protein
MKTENEDAAKTYLVYKHKETGELKEYTSEELPWRDSVWRETFEFVDQRYDDSEVIKKHHLLIENTKGTDFTKPLVENPGYQFLLIVYDIEAANPGGMVKASALFESTLNKDVGVAMITSSDMETVFKYFEVYALKYPVFLADDIELKAMIRSNPGLLLLKDGVVQKKWHHNDFPDTWREARLELID